MYADLQISHFLNTASFYLLEDNELRSGYCVSADRDGTCERCRVSTPVKVRLKTPLINPRYTTIREEQRNNVMNSCSGLLCLYTRQPWDRLMICNPLTSEFIRLPKSGNARERTYDFMICGFGFSPQHNEYKVIIHSDDRGTAIHTIGTKSWRTLESWPTSLKLKDVSTVSAVYLDGSLYWIVYGGEGDSLFTFDLNTERSRVHSLPIEHCGRSIIVARGHLYLYDTSDWPRVQIWVMMETGNPNHWSKLFSIDLSPYGIGNYQLLLCENEEVAVIFDDYKNILIYFDRLQGLKSKPVKFRRFELFFTALAYTPSFMSLEDIFRVGNVEVLKIKKRRGKCEDEETGPLLLGGGRHSSSRTHG